MEMIKKIKAKRKSSKTQGLVNEKRSKSKRGSNDPVSVEVTQDQDEEQKKDRTKSKNKKKRSKGRSKRRLRTRSHSSTEQTTEDPPTTDNTAEDDIHRRRRSARSKQPSKRQTSSMQPSSTDQKLPTKKDSKEEITAVSKPTSTVAKKQPSSGNLVPYEQFTRPVPNLYFNKPSCDCSLSKSESTARQLSGRPAPKTCAIEPHRKYFSSESPPMSDSVKPLPHTHDKKDHQHSPQQPSQTQEERN